MCAIGANVTTLIQSWKIGLSSEQEIYIKQGIKKKEIRKDIAISYTHLNPLEKIFLLASLITARLRYFDLFF